MSAASPKPPEIYGRKRRPEKKYPHVAAPGVHGEVEDFDVAGVQVGFFAVASAVEIIDLETDVPRPFEIDDLREGGAVGRGGVDADFLCRFLVGEKPASAALDGGHGLEILRRRAGRQAERQGREHYDRKPSPGHASSFAARRLSSGTPAA
ncbi:MAG: hypothetical protein M5R36_08665 [Deltaproteobacteria bacterium]|nr:hypothetical protein [Deltaproteobacteria bacterium]